MRLPDDDELYEVDQTYLGPPRRYIGEMRYRTIFLFLVIAPLTLVLLRKLGMPITLLSVGLWLLGASYLSMKCADYISSESSAGAWLMTFVHELTAPRVENEGGRAHGAGAGAAFRAASRPTGGWAKALRRMGRPVEVRPAPGPVAPRVLEAKVVYTPPPAAVRAAPQRRAIAASPVSLDKAAPGPIVGEQTRAQSGVRPWGSVKAQKDAERASQAARPTPRPSAERESRETPWQGAAPWQVRREQEHVEQERTVVRPASEPAYPQSVQEYRRSLHDDAATTDEVGVQTSDDTDGGAE